MHGTTVRRENPLIGAIVPLPDMEVATPDVLCRSGGWRALLLPRPNPLRLNGRLAGLGRPFFSPWEGAGSGPWP